MSEGKWDGIPQNPGVDGLHYIGDAAALWWAGKRKWSILHRAREESPEWLASNWWAEYRGPIPPPAVVAALVEALDAAVDCGMVPSGSAAEGGANRFVRQLQVADMIRAAVALYRGQQPPAPAPTPEPPIYDDSVERNFQSALERGEVKRTE